MTIVASPQADSRGRNGSGSPQLDSGVLASNNVLVRAVEERIRTFLVPTRKVRSGGILGPEARGGQEPGETDDQLPVVLDVTHCESLSA